MLDNKVCVAIVVMILRNKKEILGVEVIRQPLDLAIA